MSWADEVRIETPEQIDFDFEVAGPGSRSAAQVLDWIVKIFWLLLGALATFLIEAMIGKESPFAGYIVLGVMIFLGFVFFVGFDIYYEAFREGQTPGKKYIGIRVIREGGGPIDVRAAAIRNMINLADFLPVGYLLGGVICLLNKRCQRLGDMAAGTLVIREQETAKMTTEPLQLATAQNNHLFERAQLQRLSPQDRHVLESYFQRLDSLDHPTKLRLTQRLYQVFGEKMSIPSEELNEKDESLMLDFLISLNNALKISGTM
ncbi:MAG: RDD family protein [Gemmatales bacterium]